jgi:hypothetical protein
MMLCNAFNDDLYNRSFLKLIGIDTADLTEMQELVRLFVQIALLRKGPQDLPVSASLLAVTAAAFFVINFLVSTVLPPIPGPWLYQLVLDVIFIFAWYALVLRMVNRPERYLQTTTAIFGYQAVLAPLWVATVWLWRQFAEDDTWSTPTLLLALGVLVWNVSANVRVVKAALEWGVAASVALVILQNITEQALLLFLFARVL